MRGLLVASLLFILMDLPILYMQLIVGRQTLSLLTGAVKVLRARSARDGVFVHPLQPSMDAIKS
jgi:hypothetical protein